MAHSSLAAILSLSLIACGPTFSAAEGSGEATAAGTAGAEATAGTGGASGGRPGVTGGAGAAAGAILGGGGSGATAAGGGGSPAGGAGATGAPGGASAGSPEEAGAAGAGGSPDPVPPSCAAAIALAAAEPPAAFEWGGFSSSAGDMCSSSAGGSCQYLEIYRFSEDSFSAEARCEGAELFAGTCGEEASCGMLGAFRLNATYGAEPDGDGWKLVAAVPYAVQASAGMCIFGHYASNEESVLVLWEAGMEPFLGRTYPCPR